MDLTQVEKKLREARFFLRAMSEQEHKAFGDKEPFDFYLSAFLSAARTVDYRLRHELAAIYPAWRKEWDAALTSEETSLIKFMVDDRNVEIHESGSGRSAKTQGIAIAGNMYSDASGTAEIFAPPGVSAAVIYKPTYHFTIAGIERKAADAATKYLALLERMVAKFQADHP